MKGDFAAPPSTRHPPQVTHSDAKLGSPEVDVEAKLMRAEAEAEAKLVEAGAAAATTVCQAEVDAEAKLMRAEAEAEAKLVEAGTAAATTLRQAEVDAAATLERAVVPAAAKLVEAGVTAAATLREAQVAAAMTLRDAEVEAVATLERAALPNETTLRQAAQGLRDQRDVFERFFALSVDMICMSTTAGYLTRVSQSFDTLGHSRDELLARPALELVHPDDQAATQAAYATLVPGGATIHLENRCRCKDGSYRWLSWASGMDPSGIVYSLARDVTDARRRYDALVRAKDAADNVNRDLESFSYAVAHDLRAPLRSIDSFSRALLEDYVGKLDATGQKYLSYIHASTQHMARLIEGLLALARAARSEMQSEAVDLSAVALASIARLQGGERGRERRVEVWIADGLASSGDPRMLTIMIDNLLGNAWKFTAGRPDARIEFGVTVCDGQLVYFVRDNGAGFDMAHADRLFGVFQRLHTAAEFEGTGVGLATVQRIVNRHRGRVWAEGEVGLGATFYFTLHEPLAS